MFEIDPTRTEPIFQQLVSAVKRGVATGALRPGDRLPPVRDLAKQLVINPNTIARAYQMLEAQGVTLSRRGAGTFVAERRVVVRSEEARRRCREAFMEALSEAVHLGLTAEEVRAEFEAALGRLRFGGEEER